MCRATSVANASSELRRAYSRSRSMSSVGILPIHLRRPEKVTDYSYGRLTGNCLLTRRRFIDAAWVNERVCLAPEPLPLSRTLTPHESCLDNFDGGSSSCDRTPYSHERH